MLHSLFLAMTAAAISSVSLGQASFEILDWQGMPRYENGVFDHCAMVITNRDGQRLTVALRPDGDVGIGVAERDWRLSSGQEMSLTYRVAHSTWARGVATAVSRNEMMVWFSGPEYARHLRAVGQTGRISVEIGSEVVDFTLPRSTRPANALVNCVQVILDKSDRKRSRVFIESFRLR